MMKKILVIFILASFLSGCGSSDDPDNPAKNSENLIEGNIEISWGEARWRMSLPTNWEKMNPFPERGVIFLARKGTQNLVISHEEGLTKNIATRLLKTLKESLDTVEEISQTEDMIIFRGKLSFTTPLREFYQKIIPIEKTKNFILISCSQEVARIEKLDCPDILSSVS